MIHFHSKNKKAQLKIKLQLGPFIFNKREEAWEEADKILKSFQLQTSFLWSPYDPNHFISLRRVRYRLASYEHLRIPHLEKYANQLEWKEGTLVEASYKEEITQKATKNLKKATDLEYCGQVLSLAPDHFGVVASCSTAPQQPAQTITQAAATDKGKELQQEDPLPSTEQQQEQQVE